MLTAGEAQTILDACGHLRDRLCFALLLDCGVRIGEALGLRHEDMGIAERAVTVTPRPNSNRARAKAGTARTIPASAELMRLYADYLTREYGSLDSDYVFVNLWSQPYGRPWTYAAVYDLVLRLRERTGIGFEVFVEHDGYGTPLGLHTSGNDFYLVLDNLGSVAAVVNTAGTVVARYSYDPYGNAVSVDESGLGQPNILRYTGGALDQTTGLTKLGQRYYNPALGAFTQQDDREILANPQNGNLYAYAGDNPANAIDPTGLVPMPGICLPINPMCRVSGNEWGSYNPVRATIVAASGGCAAGLVTSIFFPPSAGPACGVGALATGTGAFVSYTVDWIWTHI